jgi:hypothetical protein
VKNSKVSNWVLAKQTENTWEPIVKAEILKDMSWDQMEAVRDQFAENKISSADRIQSYVDAVAADLPDEGSEAMIAL